MESSATNKQTNKEVKKIINSSNNNFLPLVKHFLMIHCFDKKKSAYLKLKIPTNLYMECQSQIINIYPFITLSAERMGQDL